MPLRNAQPYRLRPRGVTDTMDATNSAAGAMRALTNLIPDPSTPNAFYCRPAAVDISDFPGFSAPGVVSVAYQLGNLIYGMIASSLYSGHDQPFCYNAVTNTFVTVSGITSANTPTTQLATGPWSPPEMALVGIYLIIVHPGYTGGGGNYFGWFDVTTPTAPVWHAGNTTGNPLPAVPTHVELFTNRAYFAVDSNQLEFTDALTLNVTNSSQVIYVDASQPITALAPMTLITTVQGLLQVLLVFKESGIWQITGDIALSTLADNSLNTAAGTLAPRSVTPTPQGVMFMSSDGIRRVTPSGSVTDPNPDLRVPFINALYPSRVSAQYNSDTYRICVQNADAANVPFQEYWFSLGAGSWSGPHTCRQDMAVPYSNTFIMFSNANPGKMFKSDVYQTLTSAFTELGAQLTWAYTTPPSPDTGDLMQASAIETTLNMSFKAGSYAVTCTASDESAGVLSSATVNVLGATTLWGSFTWGSAIWGSAQYGMRPHLVPWTQPLVFTKLVFQAMGQSSAGFRISNFQVLYQPLGYLPAV